MTNMNDTPLALYEIWSCEFRSGTTAEYLSPQFVSRLHHRLQGALTEEVQRITRVVNIVPIEVDIVIDPRTCLRALRRMGLILGE